MTCGVPLRILSFCLFILFMGFSRQEYRSGLIFPPPVDHILSELFTMTRNQIDYILCNQRWRSSIQLAKTRPGADCGSDRELLIAKFRESRETQSRHSVHFSSVAQSCPTLCDPMNCSTPGLPVHYQLLEFTQTRVH